MPKGANQKLKMLYLSKIFHEQTDEEHGLTMPQIIEKLAEYDVNADRKTLYTDFEELRRFGLDIISEHVGHNTFYSLASREFELPELKLLVDSVQAAKFITDRKSRELIDKLHTAINDKCQIRFQYSQWTVNKEMALRRGGKWYQVSPWCLTWDDENYYLVAYDSADDRIKHYRVDKMQRITPTDQLREGRERVEGFDMAQYAKSVFGMFGGEETAVTLEGENRMVGVLIDRFGKDILLVPTDGEHFEAKVNVAVSAQFFGWIMALGDGIRITGPGPVVNKMKAEARRLAAQYGE